jgi:hypothetical protein
MSPGSIDFLVGVLAFVMALSSLVWHFSVRARRSSRLSWENLVRKLIWVDPKVVSQIALGLLDGPGRLEKADRDSIDASRIWEMIGGLDGLENLKKNSRVLIDLASHLQRWYPDALVIAEEMRLSARELDWHIGRLQGAAKTGNLEISFSFYASRAIAIYYRMTQQIIALYQERNLPMLADLQRAL